MYSFGPKTQAALYIYYISCAVLTFLTPNKYILEKLEYIVNYIVDWSDRCLDIYDLFNLVKPCINMFYSLLTFPLNCL